MEFYFIVIDGFRNSRPGQFGAFHYRSPVKEHIIPNTCGPRICLEDRVTGRLVHGENPFVHEYSRSRSWPIKAVTVANYCGDSNCRRTNWYHEKPDLPKREWTTCSVYESIFFFTFRNNWFVKWESRALYVLLYYEHQVFCLNSELKDKNAKKGAVGLLWSRFLRCNSFCLGLATHCFS